MKESHERSLSAFARIAGRVCVVIAAVMLLASAGCQSPAVPFDPFLAGRTTIPPPGTAAPAVAAPAAAAPYYDVAPPVVTVPGASTIYPPPGVTPAPVPTSALPPAGSGRFPRGITLPQSSTQSPRTGADLAGWQPVDSTDASDVRDSATTASGDVRVAPKSDIGVMRASHQEPAREAPIRIVAPNRK